MAPRWILQLLVRQGTTADGEHMWAVTLPRIDIQTRRLGRFSHQGEKDLRSLAVRELIHSSKETETRMRAFRKFKNVSGTGGGEDQGAR